MIILGGGIIGLTIAWQLVRSGTARVRAVIESEQFPGATAVAAGMLAPISEAFLKVDRHSVMNPFAVRTALGSE